MRPLSAARPAASQPSWAHRGKLTDEADRLAKQRAAEIITIDDADGFFGRLADLVLALRDSKRQHSASVDAAVALTKRYLADTRHRINLEELVRDEVEAAHRRIEAYSKEALKSRPDVAVTFQSYRDILERLQAMMLHGVAHGTPQQAPLWVLAIRRIAYHRDEGGPIQEDGIRDYPAVLLTCSAGLAAISKGRFDALNRLLVEPKLRRYGKTQPLLTGIDYERMDSFTKTIAGHQRSFAPVSEHLFSVLREPLRRFLPDDAEYDEMFDRFELLRAMACMHLEHTAVTEGDDYWAPLGRYCWKGRRGYAESIIKQFRVEVEEAKTDWPPLKAGMFNGSVKRTQELLGAVDRFVGRLRWR